MQPHIWKSISLLSLSTLQETCREGEKGIQLGYTDGGTLGEGAGEPPFCTQLIGINRVTFACSGIIMNLR